MSEGQGDARATSLAGHYAHCNRLVHEHDRDRWLASLFAPAEKRPHLHALYAFNIEIARIRDVVSDPMPGEIRMQWWTDAIQGETRGDVRGHPAADAFLDTVAKCGLPRADFTALIEARRFDLYDDPMPDFAALRAYCEATSSALFRSAAKILSAHKNAVGEAAHSAGIACGLTGLMRALPLHAARGQCFVPAALLAKHGMSPPDVVARRDSLALGGALAELRAIARAHLTQANAALNLADPPVRAGFLPLAVLPLYLDAMERRGYDPFTNPAEVSQLHRQWRLWRASRRR
jgi:phytoene synthase